MRHFRGYGRRVAVCDEVLAIWHGHRQTAAHAAESFGVLMGTTSLDRREAWIEAVTTPMARDRCSRLAFWLRDRGHQRAVCKRFECSGGKAIYLGTWHTHPEPEPAPSATDQNDWNGCLRANPGRPLAFVIVGTDEVRVFVRVGRRFRPLTEEDDEDDIG